MFKLLLLPLAMAVLGLGAILLAIEPTPKDRRAAAQKAHQAGNYKDAYEGFRTLALDPKGDPAQVGDDLKMGSNASTSSAGSTRSTRSARRSSRPTPTTGGSCWRRRRPSPTARTSASSSPASSPAAISAAGGTTSAPSSAIGCGPSSY